MDAVRGLHRPAVAASFKPAAPVRRPCTGSARAQTAPARPGRRIRTLMSDVSTPGSAGRCRLLRQARKTAT